LTSNVRMHYHACRVWPSMDYYLVQNIKKISFQIINICLYLQYALLRIFETSDWSNEDDNDDIFTWVFEATKPRHQYYNSYNSQGKKGKYMSC